MPEKRFTAVNFPKQYPQEDVAEHEVLMAFNDDVDAVAFRQWWEEQGAHVFAVWLASNRRDGQ